MKFDALPNITGGELASLHFNEEVHALIIDSRKPFITQGAVFFAIAGPRHDGHQYVQELYDKGVRQFVVESDIEISGDADILVVKNAIAALQAISSHHRELFNIPIVGITGSNGKTITKEWLFSCLSPDHKIARSPYSYNSQIGVPLSVWSLNSSHDLGIFEAGISEPGEMAKLTEIIKPTIGIFTNLGAAHDEGFSSRAQKLEGKSLLFSSADRIIFNGDKPDVFAKFKSKAFSWGKDPHNIVHIISQTISHGGATIKLTYRGEQLSFKLPFADQASVENCMHCVTYMLFDGYDAATIQARVSKLMPLNMRLELKKAINNSHIIDDSYNNDMGGLQRAVEFLAQQKQSDKKIIILSDIPQSGLEEKELYQEVAQILNSSDINTVVCIGEAITKNAALFKATTISFPSTESFLNDIGNIDLSKAVILAKGARSFAFEKIIKSLEEKIHGTVLEINLDALTNNLNFYRSRVKSSTKMMVMVKAFGYGSGSFEVANLMQYHRVDYLGVAYADEGVTLRENGIYLPIMVMNPSEDSFEALLNFNLEPEMYGLSILKRYINFLNGKEASIHLKLETGMNRLGIEEEEIDELIVLLADNKNLTVNSIFSHLAGSDDQNHNEFSKQQAATFQAMSSRIIEKLRYKPLLHLVNSPGILRFPEYHFDMVRLGIGLYGLEANNSNEQVQLHRISVLKTVISQIRKINKGETIGYGRKGIANEELTIATIAIGYADGFSRAFSNGKGSVCINGKMAPVIGNVCMDMTMVDITGIDAKEGDDVEIFGKNISIKELADKIDTIPYEILTNVSQRVKRVYFAE